MPTVIAHYTVPRLPSLIRARLRRLLYFSCFGVVRVVRDVVDKESKKS